jgi:hypothetical protein
VYCNDLSRPWFRVQDSQCLEKIKPNEQQNCSITKCPEWKVTSWSNCSGKCGFAKHYRHVWCSHNGLEIDDNYCLQIYQKKPLTMEICNQDMYCPKWINGIWSEVGFSFVIFIINFMISVR